VLTDYHTHLRPDSPQAAAAEHFREENLRRYLDEAAARGIEELGFSEHVYRFRQALALWRHPFWETYATDDLDAYCSFVIEMRGAGHSVKLGLEVDYVPGQEERTAELLRGYPFDYVIGSVHFIADRAVDHEGYDAWRQASADDVWSEYFRTLGDAAASGLFDVLAHPDLVKVWGAERPSPTRPRQAFYELAMDGIERSDIAVEVSTAGLRKPVREIYPSEELLRMCIAAGKPIALSSDAHEPEQLGYGYDSAVDLLERCGVTEISVFDGRRRSDAPLG
jgi:histidinol-phosphatase (PHP family)